MADIAQSHVDGNVPEAKVFDEYMRRDLAGALCVTKTPCKVQYELLRQGATQTGVAYPKFYVWVKITPSEGQITQGAVRLAAIEKQRFDVTDFLTKEQIRTKPERVKNTFPAALVDKILDKAK